MAAVNKPVDLKQKEADVNRKLQIYGIISAFQSGKVPSNDQIDVALNSFLASPALSRPSAKLSTEGKALIGDVRDVVTQAKRLLLSKNEGNLLQDFIWQTQQFDPKAVGTPNTPVNKETAKQHGDKALEGLRTLGTLIITNGQFRKLLSDATILLRDMAGDAATNAASKVRPDEERLAQVDRPADDNTWHDAPNFTKDNVKQQLQSAYKGDPKADANAVAQNATAAAQVNEKGYEDADINSGLEAAKQTAQERTGITDEDAEKAKVATKQRAAEYRARTQEYLKKKMPQDRRDQTIWRLKKMIIECQQHQDYQEAISTLLDLAEQYTGHANMLAKGSTGTVKDARSNLAQAESDLKTLIERFANGTSSDDLWSAVNQIYVDAQNDPELKNWFKSMDKYIRRCLQEQGYILEEASTQDWNQLYDHGNYLLRNKYRTHTDHVLDEIKFLGNQFDEDAQNKQFAQSVNKLFTDLGNDQNGKPTFKPHLIKDLTEVILPSIFENVAYIPIPRIEYSDPQVDAVIENLVLESDNFMPNLLEIHNENHVRWGRKKIGNSNQHSFEVKVSGIQMDLRDVSFYIKRKQGMPKITDSIVADILLPGDGFSFDLKLSTADKKDSANFFKVDKVDVTLKDMKVKIKKSNHKLLFTLVKSIALKAMRPALQKVAEKAIKDNFSQADSFLRQVQIEADRAIEEAREDPQNAPNIYKRYTDALQKQFLQAKQKAQSAQQSIAEKKLNIAMTKEESIFPDIHLPGGISSKATEYKELARKGDKWNSPVFSIGAAGKSSDIPSPPKVTRKPHATGTTNGHNGVYPDGYNGTHQSGPNGTYSGGNNGYYSASSDYKTLDPAVANPSIPTTRIS